MVRNRHRRRVPEAGFSRERRLDPQITVGLLTDATGMPLMIDAFEGNRGETKTMIPLVQRFVAAHGRWPASNPRLGPASLAG